MRKKYSFPYSMREAETLNAEQYTCPGCGINDRSRLYALYLQKNIDLARQYDLVDFAPSRPLSSFIRKFGNIRYRTADLFMEGVDDKIDLMNLDVYKDCSFDIFICSHILEHVDDDIKAMSELYRILKPGGFGIAMVPINKKVVKTKEDPSIKDQALRWKYFGQGDHVRLYDRQDYIKRLRMVGFVVNEYDKTYFGDHVFKKHGLSNSSVLYIVEK